MRCAVYNCSSNNSKGKSTLRFYCFPKKAGIQKKWIKFCRRKDNFNPKTSRICSAHFTAEDFERNLQFEMGFCERNGYNLKPGACPTAKPQSTVEPSSRDIRMKCRAKQNMITSLLKETPVPPIVPKPTKPYDADQIEISYVVDVVDETTIQLQNQIDVLKQEIESLKLKNFTILEERKDYQLQIRTLKKMLSKSEFERINMENKLQEIFTAGQVNKLKNGSKRCQWSEADIVQSFTIYSTSPKAYKLLQQKNFPLPCVRTLQIWAQRLAPGVIDPDGENIVSSNST